MTTSHGATVRLMPFRMVDRIDEYEAGAFLRARKLTSAQEEYWIRVGDAAVMPAELVLESFLQAAGLLVILSTDAPRYAALPTSIGQVARLGSVVPGEILALDVRVDRFDDEIAVFSGDVAVHDRPVLRVASAMFVMTPLETLADPIEVLPRLARLRRDPSAASPGANGAGPLSFLAPS